MKYAYQKLSKREKNCLPKQPKSREEKRVRVDKRINIKIDTFLKLLLINRGFHFVTSSWPKTFVLKKLKCKPVTHLKSKRTWKKMDWLIYKISSKNWYWKSEKLMNPYTNSIFCLRVFLNYCRLLVSFLFLVKL